MYTNTVMIRIFKKCIVLDVRKCRAISQFLFEKDETE